MKSITLLFGTGLFTYAIEIILMAGCLAYLIQKRGKTFSWLVALPLLTFFFAFNEIYYIPAIINANVTFTFNNQELANFFEIGQNESLTRFIIEDSISFFSWFVEAVLSYVIALALTKKQTEK